MIPAWKISADTALREKLWAGSIPVRIDLSYKDISALEPPKPMYILANRLTYFATFLKDIKRHFDPSAPSPCDQSEIWLDFNKNPLSWNIPIGVLFDLLQPDQQVVPWSLTLHYREIPDKKIMRFTGVDSIRFFYINSLKEAMYLRTNSSKDVMGLPKALETKLLESILTSKLFPKPILVNFMDFWSINSKLIDVPCEEIKKTSIRVYYNSDETYIQLPGNLVDESGNYITIGEYLYNYICPELLERRAEDGQTVVVKASDKNSRILVHGIECALETPLYWMHLNMAYIDNFVYIAISTDK